MKNVMFIVLLFCAATKLTAQTTYDEFWAFGRNCGMQFSNDSVVVINSRANDFAITTSVFPNDLGSGIYYSGGKLFEVNGNTLINDTDLVSIDFSYKTALLLTIKDSSFYFLGLKDNFDGSCPSLLCLDLIAWKVIVSSSGYNFIPLNYSFNDNLLEGRLAAVKHTNGKDWWLITHEIPKGIVADTPTSKFVKFLLQQDTIMGPFYQEIGTAHNTDELFLGDISFSGSGEQLALSLTVSGIIDLFDFDRCTGQLSDHVSINGGSAKKYGGIEFSENERFLYAVTGRGYDPNKLYQYDLTQSNIAGSEVLLWDEPDYVTYRSGSLKRGPDGKIYLASYVDDTTLNNAHRKLGVIHEPDSAGLACNFVPFDLELLPSCRVVFGLPNIPNYNLGATSIFQADAGVDTFLCIRDTVAKGMSIGAESVPGVSYEWLNVDVSNVNKYNSRAFVAVDSSTWFYLQLTDTTIQGSCQTRIDSVLVERRLCTGVEEIDQAQVKVYPNPANDVLHIDIPTQGSLELYDLSGRLLLNQPLTKGNNRVVLQGISLSSGMLIYKVYTNGHLSLTDKLVIME